MARLTSSASQTFPARQRGAGMSADQVTPGIDCTYPLDRVPEAMRHPEAGDVRGKLAITI